MVEFEPELKQSELKAREPGTRLFDCWLSFGSLADSYFHCVTSQDGPLSLSALPLVG